jgi:N,N'-diacetyllegionaminate synthase
MKVRTTIIAEIGVNHNGNISLAKQLIDVASHAGADLVKFQTFNTSALVIKNSTMADYQKNNNRQYKSQFDMLKCLELTLEMHKDLQSYCKKKKIEFFSTAFDIKSLDFLNDIGLKFFKVPSGELTNLPYLRHVASFGKPLIISTGMATLDEVEESLKTIEKYGVKRKDVTILHCNTAYPTPIKDVNLKAMCTIRDKLKVAVGYSDHTLGFEVSLAAVGLGATIIEKHLTIDRNLSGPDHNSSLEPDEFTKMVQCIRNIEEALGSGIKKPSNSELKNKLVVRKSLVAIKPIRKGDIFSKKNIGVKRPGTGISPMLWDKVIGQIATKDFVEDELITI